MFVELASIAMLAAAPPPLFEADAAVFAGSPEERLAKEACDGERRVTPTCKDAVSYVFSNEDEHRAFRPHIAGIGGGYVGVGADHGLTFVAWARSELAWMMDYDPEVVRLNRIHLAFVAEAQTPAAFRDLWRARRRSQARRAIRRALGAR